MSHAPVTRPSLEIGQAELAARAGRFLEHVRGERLRGAVIFDRDAILYYTGFAFIPTERPMAFILSERGEKAMFVPRLELEHARSRTGIERIESYVEYPYDPHPMEALKRVLSDLGIRDGIGADEDGYPWMFGYRR